MKLAQKVIELTKRSNQNLTTVDALKDLGHASFNTVVLGKGFRGIFPMINAWCREDFSVGMDRYRNDPDGWKCLGELQEQYFDLIAETEPFTDHMTDLIGALPLNKKLCQFLTPTSLATGLMGFLGMKEPTETCLIGDTGGCGAGALVMAQVKYLYEHYPDQVHNVRVIIKDLDAQMVRMTVAQLALASISHQVPLGGIDAHCGNAITEYNRPTKVFHFYPNTHGDATPGYPALGTLRCDLPTHG